MFTVLNVILTDLLLNHNSNHSYSKYKNKYVKTCSSAAKKRVKSSNTFDRIPVFVLLIKELTLHKYLGKRVLQQVFIVYKFTMKIFLHPWSQL